VFRNDGVGGSNPSCGTNPCFVRVGTMVGAMMKTLEIAITDLANLPDADQEHIGRSLLSRVEKLRRLREELDKGVRSLAAGEGSSFDLEQFIRHKDCRVIERRHRFT
jgi:hypothetical protein